MKKKLHLILLSFFLIICLYGCTDFLSKKNGKKDENTFDTFTFKGKALKSNGSYFEIGSKVYAVDAEGKIASGFVTDNEGNFSIDFFIDETNEKKKSLIGSIIFSVVSPTESDSQTTILPYDISSDPKVVNLNAITQLVSSEILKGLAVNSILANVRSIADNAISGKPIQLDDQTQLSLNNFDLFIPSSKIDSYSTIITNMMFGIGGVQVDFFNGNIMQNEIILLKSAYKVSGDLIIENIANTDFTPLLNQSLFYQEVALHFTLNDNYSIFFETILNSESDIYNTLTIKSDLGVSILDQLEMYLSWGGNFEIDVSKVSPQFGVLFESDSNGSVEAINSLNNFVVVKSGESLLILMVPNLGFGVESLKIDDSELEPAYKYLLQTIDANHKVSASFKRQTNTVSIGQPTWPLNDFVAISTKYQNTVALRSNGTVMDWGVRSDGLGGRFNHFKETKIDKIFVGYDRVFFIKNNGNIIEEKFDYSDVQLGDGNLVDPNLKGAMSIAAGYAFAVVLLNDGSITSRNFQLNNQGKDNIAISAGNSHCLILKKSGIVLELGVINDTDNIIDLVPMPEDLNNVIAISAGDRHSVVLKNDGTVVAWGDNYSGQCNVPIDLKNVIAISAGDNHTTALINDGTVVEWGTIDPSDYFNKDSPFIPFPADLNGVVSISSGRSHTVALKNDGSLVSWGVNTHGQVINSTNKEIKNILAPPYYEMALFEDGSILGFGSANYDKAQSVSDLISMSVSDKFLLLLKGDGTLWGSSLFSNSSDLLFGGYWEFSPIFPEISEIKAIATGSSHALFLTSDGTVEARGLSNKYGETTLPVGLSDVLTIASGGNHSLALKQNGEVIAWGKNEDGESNVPVGLTNVIAIAAGATHSVALKSDGTVVGWGNNEFGQLNIPSDLSNVVSIKAGDYHTVVLKSDGSVLAWGSNDYGQASMPDNLLPVKSIDAGKTNTILSFK